MHNLDNWDMRRVVPPDLSKSNGMSDLPTWHGESYFEIIEPGTLEKPCPTEVCVMRASFQGQGVRSQAKKRHPAGLLVHLPKSSYRFDLAANTCLQ